MVHELLEQWLIFPHCKVNYSPNYKAIDFFNRADITSSKQCFQCF